MAKVFESELVITIKIPLNIKANNESQAENWLNQRHLGDFFEDCNNDYYSYDVDCKGKIIGEIVDLDTKGSVNISDVHEHCYEKPTMTVKEFYTKNYGADYPYVNGTEFYDVNICNVYTNEELHTNADEIDSGILDSSDWGNRTITSCQIINHALEIGVK